MLQPPVPVRRRGARPALHHRRAPRVQLRQAGHPRQAAAQAAAAGLARAHLLTDDPHAGHPGGLLPVEAV